MSKQLKILIIEDDPNIADLLQLYLEKEGYSVVIAYDGDEGLTRYYDETPDFIILDIMLPETDGWEVCRQIRIDRQVPIIMLTGRGESYDKIKGLELGADDYVVKPFDPKEVIARIKAVLRRTSSHLVAKQTVELPELMININEYKIFRNGKEITLPPKELELLYFLATQPNQVFTRQQLIEHIWGYDYDGDNRTVDVHVKRIREKIDDGSPYWTLRTIRGVGYKFEVNSVV
ncbi:DNA-binding response regulator, OmpR family, contains REC and winged-helix (wHTH) domain [Evansella caseinilytica]|uniref:DNA-binding response regulator, OmpR family, contains REC and winged-helix (WHTH) domain n=1 Tax=Evansella caseinilytica TaxID=1503961 RepID=A0A1H3TN02_9BACI|nr:response regulator transcription factor [Evansella caseinilytica]SDZ51634.1 DNA-binding response regulator, OmpR family, contains REC and winged-helix (wHTH) domain [Evansella caseinilytica]